MDPATVYRIASSLLGAEIDPATGYGPCPGAHCHTTPSGARDWRLFVDPAAPLHPREHCFHASCAPARDDFMSRLYTELRRMADPEARHHIPAAPAPAAPPAPKKIKPTFDLATAQAIASRCPGFNVERLTRISPIPIPPQPDQWPTLLINTLYPAGSRILIFDNMLSQGQYIHIAGGSTYRLHHRPGTPATPVDALPLTTSPDGMWYLAAPITGAWLPKNPANPTALGRRHAACCTSFPYAVIESDTLPPETWLPILAQLQDPIVAIYTSGKKSIHALIRVGARSKEEFNTARDILLRRLVPIGADPAAITPVRLTRLPGALRSGHLQRLLYLNPSPLPHTPLCRLSLRR